jgi:hypothetical protein
MSFLYGRAPDTNEGQEAHQGARGRGGPLRETFPAFSEYSVQLTIATDG